MISKAILFPKVASDRNTNSLAVGNGTRGELGEVFLCFFLEDGVATDSSRDRCVVKFATLKMLTN